MGDMANAAWEGRFFGDIRAQGLKQGYHGKFVHVKG